MKKKKRVVILHISEFGGHSKAAQNLKEALYYTNPDIEVVNTNGLGYFYPRGEKVVDFFYTLTIRHFPSIWGGAYDRRNVIKALTPYRSLINRFVFGKLNKFIKKYDPDCFVATQAFPCGLVADFKKSKGLKIPVIAVVTDYYPHRFWVHPFVDKYVVACQEAKDILLKEGVKEERIKVLGIPISVKFLTTYPKDEVSKKLGFMQGRKSVLIMGGGLGIGPIKIIAKALDDLPYDFQIIVVCGKNENLYNWFVRSKRKFKKPIFAFPYTNYIHKIMDFSDLIITKAGGITISEALSKGLCIIVTNPIPGQEERNVNHLLSKQAIVKVYDVDKIGETVESLFMDHKKMYSLKERAKEVAIIDSSLRIVDLILESIS